ncbi:hypothetical protein B0H16DRAFT_1742507 [Mycena metata]|uniref:Uncharacterized protein n=1 Tax=Mycena metata TaxID=1033252 RepID=A0AAD7H8L0_9AGAR|nr:hypothetical protein B0H16DRAFT_1742507 [Mycena metata]
MTHPCAVDLPFRPVVHGPFFDLRDLQRDGHGTRLTGAVKPSQRQRAAALRVQCDGSCIVHRGDLPLHIELNPADWAKVGAVTEEALTQGRSKFKKLIIHSIKPHDSKSVENAASKDQLNIFQLAEAFVEGTRCSVNVPLCARIALMRKTFFKSPGAKFWDAVDGTLSKIRTRANGDNKKIAKAFRHILDDDQAKHGSADYRPEEETVDLFQQQVDDLIDANAADASSGAA